MQIIQYRQMAHENRQLKHLFDSISNRIALNIETCNIIVVISIEYYLGIDHDRPFPSKYLVLVLVLWSCFSRQVIRRSSRYRQYTRNNGNAPGEKVIYALTFL